MTAEQRALVCGLVAAPGKPPISPGEFLVRWGTRNGVALGLELLEDALQRRDAEDVEWALVVCFTFGFSDKHLDPLLTLAFADWHRRHEDVASALSDLRSPLAVGALRHLAERVPDYLGWDDAYALAGKAIWGLGNIGNDEAVETLRSLAGSPTEVIGRKAAEQLARRDR